LHAPRRRIVCSMMNKFENLLTTSQCKLKANVKA
jgi:hypothetical protein